MISSYLQGAAPSRAEIQELDRQVFGGVQQRRLQISCDDLRQSYKVTLTLSGHTWTLKKFTRLEN